MDTAEVWLKTPDGLKIFTRQWEAPNPKAVCLVIHGIGEHSGRYEALAKELNRHGFCVWSMDHRGHGRSQGRRGDCRSMEDFIGDLHLLVERAREKSPDLPRIIVGHSLGGLIALYYAARHPDLLRAVAASSPALRLAQPPPRLKVALAEGLDRILPNTPLPNGVNPRLLSHDPAVVAAYRRDPLVHRVITAGCAVALREAMKESPCLAAQLKVPCLILQAGEDRVCDANAAAEFAASVVNAPVTLRRYDGLYHEVFNEPERSRVIQDLIDWMEGILR